MYGVEPFTTRDAAAVLGVSVHQVARLVKAGRIKPAFQAPGPHGAFLFDPAEVARAKSARDDRARERAARRGGDAADS